MMKNGFLIFGLVGGIFLISQARKKKLAEQAAQEAAQAEAEAKQRSYQAQTLAQKQFADQVKQFQTLLGITPTGTVGPLTLGAAKDLGFSTLSASNILAAIAAAQKQSAKNWDQSARIVRSTQVYNAMGSGIPATFRGAWKGAAVYLDRSKNAYVQTGGFFYIPQGTKFFKSAIKNDPRTNGVFIAEVPVYASGSSGATQVRLMMFTPEMLFV